MSKEFDPKNAVYTPPEVSQYGLDAIERMKANKYRCAVFPIEGEVFEYFAPISPGQIVAVQAQTSNYKSGFMDFWEVALAKQLAVQERDEVVIHVSVEDLIEEQAFTQLAKETGENAGDMARGVVQDWSRLTMAATKIGTVPIYRIGESLARAEDMPNLYLSNMVRAIKTLVDGEVTGSPMTPAAIFFDYLQAFPFDDEVSRQELSKRRNLQVREDVYRLRKAAAYFNCPVIVGVQAKQELDAPKEMYIPGIYDGQETSAIAQRFDRIISLWMPKMTWPVNSTVRYKGGSYVAEENLLWVKITKQRGRLPSGKAWACRIDYDKNEITVDENIFG